jgi:hypothetical protein
MIDEQGPKYLGILQNFKIITLKVWRGGARNSSVGIETCYGLDGLGIESRWEQFFPHRSRPVLGLTQAPMQLVPGLSRG